MLFFFFQAEDGIRDLTVTGVQTCALPICARSSPGRNASSSASDHANPASRIADRIASSVTTVGVMPARILQSPSVAAALTILGDPPAHSITRTLSAPTATTLLHAAPDGWLA